MVVDASAIMEMLLGTGKGLQVERRVFGANETLHEPHLLDLEVLQVVRRHLLSKLIDVVRAQQALDDFRTLKFKRYAHDVFQRRIWSLRNNFTAYDAMYVALAEEIGATLVTCDSKMGSGHNAKVELI